MENNLPEQASQKFSVEELNNLDSTIKAKIRNLVSEVSEIAVINYQMASEGMSYEAIVKRSEVTLDDNFCIDADDKYVDEEGNTWESYFNGHYGAILWKPHRINGSFKWRPDINKKETK